MRQRYAGITSANDGPSALGDVHDARFLSSVLSMSAAEAELIALCACAADVAAWIPTIVPYCYS